MKKVKMHLMRFHDETEGLAAFDGPRLDVPGSTARAEGTAIKDWLRDRGVEVRYAGYRRRTFFFEADQNLFFEIKMRWF